LLRAWGAGDAEAGDSLLVALGNNLPFRDGLARVAVAKGDRAGAIEIYRRLNQPDVTAKFTAVFDPRYAQLAEQLTR
jgi:hypothetical protein